MHPSAWISAVACCVLATPASARQLVVSPVHGGAPIAAALARALPGDTILLRAGVYREPTLLIGTPVTLRGEPGAILDGDAQRGLIIVRADAVTLEDLVLRNTGSSGIDDRAAVRILEVGDCRVQRLHIERSFFGIYLARTSRCQLQDNVIAGTRGGEMDAGNAIHLWNAREITLARNTVEYHRDGIYFEFTRGTRAEDNVSRFNSRYGLHFMFSDSCTYVRNHFVHNGAGIAVMYSNVITMRHNEMGYARGSAAFGLLLKSISDSRLEGNWVHDNSVGLHLEDANRNDITGNRLENNGFAVRLMSNADNNTFRRNNFQRNAFDVSQSNERAGTTFTANYWDAYRGYDLNRDGIGDIPHRPVRLLAVVVERNPPALILLRSLLMDLLELAERAFPVLTPASVQDTAPTMRPNA
jgi:nitrous oxidase accessory protein